MNFISFFRLTLVGDNENLHHLQPHSDNFIPLYLSYLPLSETRPALRLSLSCISWVVEAGSLKGLLYLDKATSRFIAVGSPTYSCGNGARPNTNTLGLTKEDNR